MADTKLVIPDVLSGEGESKRMVRVRKTCDECGEPAVYRHTYLLPNGRSNPASSAYRHDDCSWCSDHEVFTCADCKRPRVDGYSHCSTFTIGERFAHLFLTWAEVSTPDPRLAAAQGLADALKVAQWLIDPSGGGGVFCPECRQDKSRGHHVECSIASALTAWEKAVR